MLDTIFIIANEEYFLSLSGGSNDIKSDIHTLKKIYINVNLIKLSPSLYNKNIDRIRRGIDHLFFSGFLSFERFFTFVNPIDYKKNLRITNVKDLHFFRELRHEMLTNKGVGSHKNIMERELSVYKYSHLVLSYSNEEIRLLNSINSGINARKHFYFNPEFFPSQRFNFNNKLIFIGNFQHEPNIDSIMYFDRTYTFNPYEFEFKIYGQFAFERLKGILINNKYSIIGQVKDSIECYSQGGLFVSPIRFGGGVKIKIIEAALSQIPIVASKESVEGLDLVADESYIPLINNDFFQKTLFMFKSQDDYFKKIAAAGHRKIKKISNEETVYMSLSANINELSSYYIS